MSSFLIENQGLAKIITGRGEPLPVEDCIFFGKRFLGYSIAP